MIKTRNNGFTLIELLVVIAIIAILAAILFPVFAQAKTAAKKTVDLSNLKQLGTSAQIYANDFDDTFPEYNWPESYQAFAKMYPYVKSNDIFKSPSSPYKQGSLQRKQVDNGSGNYMLPPDDACVGIGPSKYLSGSAAEAIVGGASGPGASNYYVDIYPATDYFTNPTLQGYQDQTASNPTGSCAVNGKYKYLHPAANTTTGGTIGATQGVGAAGMSYTSVAKAVYIATFPHLGTEWPGSATNGFWGSNFKGFYGDGSNFGMVDSHAKFFKSATSNPDGTEDTGPVYSWNSNPQAGNSWQGWGPTVASAKNQ